MTAEPALTLPPYTIRRSTRARRSRLTITNDGRAVVTLPVQAPDNMALDLVSRHRRWIERHQGRIRERASARAARPPLGAGRTIPFAGVSRRVVHIAAIDGHRHPRFRLEEDRLVVVSPPLEGRSAAELMEPWLRVQARTAIHQRLSIRAPEMGLEPVRVTIRDQRTRWGSASARGTLSFSWRLIMCPPWVLDYVVVHELAHLRVAGHSQRFWRLVDRHVADSRAARRWLREHQDEIRHALD